MKIALDAMGGDYAPEAIVKGAALGRKNLPEDAHIVLIGKEDLIKEELNKIGEPLDAYTIVHADEVIEMGEHPTKAISQKKNSSIIVGYHLLKTGQVDVFSSCGNTGAMLVGAMFTIKSIEGVIRPGIAGFIPKLTGKYGILLDVGANADCKPDVLNQFAEMGSIYYEHTFNQKAPRVGLLNLGEEETKGTLLTQAAFQLLKINSKINFIGNVEGRDVFTDKADIIICDGFSGNIVLKLSESMYPILKERDFVDDFVELFNWANVGGSPILGVNGNVIIGHGVSTPDAVNNMLHLSYQTGKSNFSEKIKSLYQ